MGDIAAGLHDDFDGNGGMYGDEDRVPTTTTTGSVHTIVRTDGYTTSNTLMSGHATLGHMNMHASGGLHFLWNQDEDCGGLDGDFFEELTNGMMDGAVLPDSAGDNGDGLYSSQEGYSTDEGGEGTSQGSQRSREVSLPSASTPLQTVKKFKAPSRQANMQMASDSNLGEEAATASANREPQSCPRKSPAVSEISSSNALGSRRRRDGDPNAEAARESRRRRWMNAYDAPGQSSRNSSMRESGYTVPNSSAYTVTSGTSASRHS